MGVGPRSDKGPEKKVPLILRKFALFMGVAAFVVALLFAADFYYSGTKRHGVSTPDNVGLADSRSGCEIKGNVTRDEVRIYHLPGSQFYVSTQIDAAEGERWFCSEDEARAAGWSKAPR